MEKLPSISDLVKDRAQFNAFVYTPLPEALQELEKRRKNPELEKKINDILHGDIPEPLTEKPKAVLFRQVITPNYEVRRFVSLIDGYSKLEPLFWEYHADKYTPNNEYKRALGRLFFFHGRGKKGGSKIDSLNIIDFNQSNGKSIASLKTLWGQDFADFHHEFFETCFRSMPEAFFDSSKWFAHNGRNANGYYKSFLSLFVKHGILFENFLLDETEFLFTKNVALPAFIDVYRQTGLKPLIVALEPTNIEGEKFWLCYPGSNRRFVEDNGKMGQPNSCMKTRKKIKFVIKNTSKYGKGVFADQDIRRGQVIHVLGGKAMSVKDFVAQVNSDQENIDDPLQVGKKTYINLDELSRTFNHSCDPNAGLRKRSELFALRHISCGEEITYDYSLTIAPTKWGMRCACGSRNCRKVLGDVLSIPKNRLDEYRKMGNIQNYMRRLLDKIKRDGGYTMPKYEKYLLGNVKKTSNL